MPRYLLDTNILIYIRQHKPARVRRHFARQPSGSVGMSAITWGELLYGAYHSSDARGSMAKLTRLQAGIPALPLPLEAADHYGQIRANLAARGLLIGANDLWIAAHARAADLTLVTNNEREFRRVPGLKVENWVAA